MAKRVLLVIESFHIGGAERQAFNLATGLKEKGYDVIIGAFNLNGPLLEECQKQTLSFIKLPGNFTSNSFQYHQPIKNLLKVFIPLWLSLFKIRPAIIIPFTAPCNVAINFIVRYLPWVKSFWNQRDDGLGMHPDEYWVIDKAIHRCSAVISNSSKGGDFLRDLSKNSTLPVAIIYNGIISKEPKFSISEWRSILNVSVGTKIALMIANVHSAKDHETAIKAWALVINQMESPPLLVFAGKYSESDPAFSKLVLLSKELGIEEHIRFLGFNPDISGLIQCSSLCIFASHREGIPNAVLEPMSLRVPVVATDLPGIREALGDDYPYISSHQDHRTFGEKIVFLLKHPKEYQEAVFRNTERVNKYFSQEVMVQKYIQLIEHYS